MLVPQSFTKSFSHQLISNHVIFSTPLTSTIPSTTQSSSIIIPNIASSVSIKLDCDNHLLWKSQFVPILRANKLQKFVDVNFLSEDVYISQPQGFVDPSHVTHVCKRHKSICGLKEAPRAWFFHLSNYLQGLGFHISMANSSLFIQNVDECIIIILICVDDILTTSIYSEAFSSILAELYRLFAMKDLGVPTLFTDWSYGNISFRVQIYLWSSSLNQNGWCHANKLLGQFWIQIVQIWMWTLA